MSKVFGKNSSPSLDPKRNTFDLSHQNNLTMRFGRLYPFHVEPVIPGDTAKIDVAFGLRAMPTAFPTQTKIRVDAHYFYVRNRNLWKDWPNFIGMTGDTSSFELPYLSPNKVLSHLKTGSLGDYMGLPTTVVGDSAEVHNVPPAGSPLDGTKIYFVPSFFGERDITGGTIPSADVPEDFELLLSEGANFSNFANGSPVDLSFLVGNSSAAILYYEVSVGQSVFEALKSRAGYFYFFSKKVDRFGYLTPLPFLGVGRVLSSVVNSNGTVSLKLQFDLDFDYFNASSDFFLAALKECVLSFITPFTSLLIEPEDVSFPSSYIRVPNDELLDFNSTTLETQQAAGESLKISSLPFRAYESIYNSFYRDQRNNPFLVNGVNDPNVYLRSKDGGVDDLEYDFYNRNWEQDFLTTAVPSPQQGIAPLVGITSYGDATFRDADGVERVVRLKTDDGDHVVGAEFSSDLPNDVNRAIVNMATSGFSIADFRGVNALQRWLEINMRRGLKYKDQIKSHFGVDVSYAELDMPEFIGGFTKWFDSSQVNQTSDGSNGDPLGSYAGQLSAVGGTEHTIKHFCDEHGYIIGIVSIVPVPVYDQLCPKDFLKRSPLDYFFPEFGHLGFQPITYREVAPLQAIVVGGQSAVEMLNSTYGYQRAWYEYLARTDEAHGDFRIMLRDFLLARKYKTLPSLTEDFLTVDPEDLNAIFTINDIGGIPVDPFLGQIHIRNIMKRPIPLYGIPRLE